LKLTHSNYTDKEASAYKQLEDHDSLKWMEKIVASLPEQKIKGKALVLFTSSSSGSSIEAEHLFANEVSSQSTSGSSTDINPLVSLKAKASSGSSIEYRNIPKTLSKEESSGGSVSRD